MKILLYCGTQSEVYGILDIFRKTCPAQASHAAFRNPEAFGDADAESIDLAMIDDEVSDTMVNKMRSQYGNRNIPICFVNKDEDNLVITIPVVNEVLETDIEAITKGALIEKLVLLDYSAVTNPEVEEIDQTSLEDALGNSLHNNSESAAEEAARLQAEADAAAEEEEEDRFAAQLAEEAKEAQAQKAADCEAQRVAEVKEMTVPELKRYLEDNLVQYDDSLLKADLLALAIAKPAEETEE